MPMIRELATFVRHALHHPSPWPNRAAALVRFGARQVHKRLVRAPLHVTWEGFELEVPPEAKFAAAAFYFGRPDWWEFAFIEKLLRAGDTAADVGANVGIYTLFLAKCVGAGGRVHACEPDPANLVLLKRQVERNQLSQVQLVEAAVGDRVGVARFAAGQDTVGHLATGPGPGTIEVPLTTLDAVYPEAGPVFVKVDVEGFELDVVRGAQRLMARGRPLAWQLELLDHGPGRRPDDVARLLRDHGYAFFRYDPNSGALVAADWRKPDGNNLLAVRDLEAVLERLNGS